MSEQHRWWMTLTVGSALLGALAWAVFGLACGGGNGVI